MMGSVGIFKYVVLQKTSGTGHPGDFAMNFRDFSLINESFAVDSLSTKPF